MRSGWSGRTKRQAMPHRLRHVQRTALRNLRDQRICAIRHRQEVCGLQRKLLEFQIRRADGWRKNQSGRIRAAGKIQLKPHVRARAGKILEVLTPLHPREGMQAPVHTQSHRPACAARHPHANIVQVPLNPVRHRIIVIAFERLVEHRLSGVDLPTVLDVVPEVQNVIRNSIERRVSAGNLKLVPIRHGPGQRVAVLEVVGYRESVGCPGQHNALRRVPVHLRLQQVVGRVHVDVCVAGRSGRRRTLRDNCRRDRQLGDDYRRQSSRKQCRDPGCDRAFAQRGIRS